MKIKEVMIMSLLTRCWNVFLELDSQHPDEQKDFMEGIHKCQYVMAMRCARQYEPGLFTNKNKKGNK